jgi:2-oxoglutarate ferredoxin oxidoreductase subunit alpha
MTKRLLSGNEAVAEAAIAAGCRFFAGYPISPFTGLLEHLSAKMGRNGGVCINAETEIEAINMVIGAGAAGARAATGSCGQGLALMQEGIAEAALNETPLVIFNMARNQQDYFQATRGGGWGDYRTITYAPKDVKEAADFTQKLFYLADKYRVPTMLYGDPIIAQTQQGLEISPHAFEALPEKSWALDGKGAGSGKTKQIWTWAMGKANAPGPGPDGQWRYIAEKFAAIDAAEAVSESRYCDDADVVVVAFGTGALFVESVVETLRSEGLRIGWFRPVTLWPFDGAALKEATNSASLTLVYELNAGQMIDDVKIHCANRETVRFIGGVSIHASGLSFGPLLDAPVIEARIREVLRQENP